MTSGENGTLNLIYFIFIRVLIKYLHIQKYIKQKKQAAGKSYLFMFESRKRKERERQNAQD